MVRHSGAAVTLEPLFSQTDSNTHHGRYRGIIDLISREPSLRPHRPFPGARPKGLVPHRHACGLSDERFPCLTEAD